ncbi:hypothetical protein [Embleya sp. NBC_00896]|uniref:hypothetical protein n=1 Tax=Embleya sp. NBC_00896 TaxID=2975961 RepID=UPI003867F050|nr:hypothetical protein OG928_45355 [Embleya sp. NBC_00896]
MERQKNEAFQLAAQTAHLGPIQGWLTVWAGEVEVERRPDLLARRHAAGRAPTGRRPGPGRPTGSGGRRDLMCS